MANLEVIGAAGGEVTGSANLLSLRNGKKVLVDFGAYQGHVNQDARNQSLENMDFSNLEGVFITHAHEELDIPRISLPKEGDIVDFNTRMSQAT